MKTPDQIAADSEHLDGVANIRAINRAFRAQDESHKWPVSGRFDATERAIRRLRREGYDLLGLEYAYALDQTISDIVNAQV